MNVLIDIFTWFLIIWLAPMWFFALAMALVPGSISTAAFAAMQYTLYLPAYLFAELLPPRYRATLLERLRMAFSPERAKTIVYGNDDGLLYPGFRLILSDDDTYCLVDLRIILRLPAYRYVVLRFGWDCERWCRNPSPLAAQRAGRFMLPQFRYLNPHYVE